MGSGKKRVQQGVESRVGQGQALEDQRAQEMKDSLTGRRNSAIGNIDEVNPQVKTANTSQLGGIDPAAQSRIQNKFAQTGAIGDKLVSSANYTPLTPQERQQQIVDSSYGRGREGYAALTEGGVTGNSYGRGRETYQNFADTGGFTDASKAQFLRKSNAPIAAMYGRAKDEMNRHAAIGGFNSSDARILRQQSNAGAEASTSANVALDNQIRQGRLSGAEGLERTRTAAGEEHLAALGGLANTREASGREAQSAIDSNIAGRNSNTTALSAAGNLAATEAKGNLDLELGQARTKQDAINSTQKYLESMQGEVSDSDRMQISNRLAQLGMTQADINALLGVAAQKTSVTQQIGNISGIVSDVGGAFGGVAGGISKLK